MESAEPIKILVFTEWYLPGYRAGGPIRSLANLVEHLPYHFYLVTSDTDHHCEEPYSGIEVEKWQQRSQNEWVYYSRKGSLDLSKVSALLKERDYHRIYLNSLFSLPFTLLPLRAAKKAGLADRVILAPRGMLKPDALAIKPTKKKIFLWIAKRIGLFRSLVWHATHATEEKEIRRIFGPNCRIHISPNLSGPQTPDGKRPPKDAGILKLITVARVSAEKGIEESIRFLNASIQTGKVEWNIYGTLQDERYYEICRKLAAESRARVVFHGEKPYEEILHLLDEHHFFYLATRGENFGHAIADSFIRGLPVIISNRTPWVGLADLGCGWDLPLQESAFVPVLQHSLAMGDDEYRTFSAAALAVGRSIAGNRANIEAATNLFE